MRVTKVARLSARELEGIRAARCNGKRAFRFEVREELAEGKWKARPMFENLVNQTRGKSDHPNRCAIVGPTRATAEVVADAAMYEMCRLVRMRYTKLARPPSC